MSSVLRNAFGIGNLTRDMFLPKENDGLAVNTWFDIDLFAYDFFSCVYAGGSFSNFSDVNVMFDIKGFIKHDDYWVALVQFCDTNYLRFEYDEQNKRLRWLNVLWANPNNNVSGAVPICNFCAYRIIPGALEIVESPFSVTSATFTVPYDLKKLYGFDEIIIKADIGTVSPYLEISHGGCLCQESPITKLRSPYNTEIVLDTKSGNNTINYGGYSSNIVIKSIKGVIY